MYDDLKGKTAFITGAGKRTGIGFAIAEKLASSVPTCINVMTDPTTVSPGSVVLTNIGSYK